MQLNAFGSDRRASLFKESSNMTALTIFLVEHDACVPFEARVARCASNQHRGLGLMRKAVKAG
jgi:hypothetical protein